MISPIYWFILALTIAVVSPTYDPRCKRLSNGCEIKLYYCNRNAEQLCYFYVCDKIDLNFQFSQPEMELLQNCSSNNSEVLYALNNIYFRLTKASFLDSTFDLFNNKLFFSSILETDDIFYFVILQSYFSIHYKITFRYIKGFDSGLTFNNLTNVRFTFFLIDFYYSNFDFYINRSLIRSCNDIDCENIPKYVFYSIPFQNLIIRLINSEYKTKTCPLILFNMNIDSIEFNGIQNTFYKTNFPRFFPISNFSFNKSNISLPRNKIVNLYLINMLKIELNSVIINDFLFSDIEELRLYGDIVSIEKGLFKSFKNLKMIELDILSTRKLFHHGIDWVFDLNADTNVDINNLSPFEDSYNLCAQIFINGISNDKRTISNLDFNFMDYFPDEDFCLYDQFPFKQLIFMNFIGVQLKGKDYSCTYLWFYQHFKKLREFCTPDLINFLNNYLKYIPEVDKEKIDKCNFKQRINNCNRSQFNTNNTSDISSYYDVKRTADLINLILIVSLPIICLLGIVSNSLVIYTVSHKSNQKDLKENQYKYMRLNAIFNILILLIQPLTLISECRDYNSLFCSSIRFWQFSQFFKIIFGEYFSNVFRLAANLTYVQFALNRLSLIGKDHGKIVTDASKLKMEQYICRIIIPCLVLPVVKVFRYFPNSYRIALDYPIPIGYYSQHINHSLMFVYMTFNALFDFLNNFVFLVVNLIIDVNLAIKMKQTIDEKKKNKASIKNSDSNKKKDDPVKRTVVMVILNAILGMILRLASVVNSILDWVFFIKNLFYPFGFVGHSYTFCQNDNSCFLIEKFSNILYLISLSIYLIFFYNFDKNFRISFLRLFVIKKEEY